MCALDAAALELGCWCRCRALLPDVWLCALWNLVAAAAAECRRKCCCDVSLVECALEAGCWRRWRELQSAAAVCCPTKVFGYVSWSHSPIRSPQIAMVSVVLVRCCERAVCAVSVLVPVLGAGAGAGCRCRCKPV